MASDDKRWRHQGRRTSPTFIQIPHFIMESPQWAALDPLALKLLFELARQYRGSNNGDLAATLSMLKARGWRSADTLTRRLEMLKNAGWIVQTRQGGRHIGCSLFAVTWWPIDECGGKHSEPPTRKASHDWKNANGVPPHGKRKTAPRKAKPLAFRDTESKVIRIRSQAS